MLWLSDASTYKMAYINGTLTYGFIDFGSSCNTVKWSVNDGLNLVCDASVIKALKSFGGSVVNSLDEVSISLRMDEIEMEVCAEVVPDYVQSIPLLIGRLGTECSDVVVVKDRQTLNFLTKQQEIWVIECDSDIGKIVLRAVRGSVMLPNHRCYVEEKAPIGS